jgi:amino acid permease
MTSFLIAGEVMGAGLLALPAAAAKLGWTISILAMFACALASSYSGSAIARVKNEFYTYADGYADLAHATGGPAFGLFARFFIVFNWSMLCPYYLISIGSTIKNMFQGVSVCNWVWPLISVALVWLGVVALAVHDAQVRLLPRDPLCSSHRPSCPHDHRPAAPRN